MTDSEIVIKETFGAGNAPGGPDGALTRVFANAIKRGMIIVNITQCETFRPKMPSFH